MYMDIHIFKHQTHLNTLLHSTDKSINNIEDIVTVH